METLPGILKFCPEEAKTRLRISTKKKIAPSPYILISFIFLFLLTITGAAYATADVPKDTVKQDSAVAAVIVETAAAVVAPVPAAPTVNKGDVSWMLVCTALVLMMSVPALALFYGGLVRSKNILSMLMQVFVTFSLITVLWCIYGYSLAFT